MPEYGMSKKLPSILILQIWTYSLKKGSNHPSEKTIVVMSLGATPMM